MASSLERCYQRFHAQGGVIIMADAPSELGTSVAEALRYPGVLTVEPKLNLGRFKEGLIANGMPLGSADKITRSLGLLEHEAYFVPAKY